MVYHHNRSQIEAKRRMIELETKRHKENYKRLVQPKSKQRAELSQQIPEKQGLITRLIAKVRKNKT